METNRIDVLEDICRIISESGRPHHSLERIVRVVARKLEADVCSVYLLDESRSYLTLQATVGLNQDLVGSIGMSLDEGLTGLVLERMEPVFVVDPASHPRHKYFSGSGEEVYRTFLGTPLVYHRKVLGVLVLQTLDPQAIGEEDVAVLTAIGSQVAATVAYSGLLEDLRRERREREGPAPSSGSTGEEPWAAKERKGLLHGFAVSPGFSEGFAHYLGKSIGFDQIEQRRSGDPQRELERLSGAIATAREEVRRLADGFRGLSGPDEAILETHLMLLEDAVFFDRVSSLIGDGYAAESALKQAVEEHVSVFRDMEDAYFQERAVDVEDAGRRVLRALLGLETGTRQFWKPTVLVASELSPVDLVALRQEHLEAIILSGGGKTSHTTILARSCEIPMVIGVTDVLENVEEGDFLIVDGNSGMVFSRPPRIIIEEYERLRVEKGRELRAYEALRETKAETVDGHVVRLGANIGLLSDLDLVERYGADHVGLYRTEFPFLARRDFPSEEEQFALYRKVVERAAGRTVTIRTLDVGGDKFLPYLDSPRESNPYLGWRSIRVSLEQDHIFRQQVRAVLKASAFGGVRLLFPMITSVTEVRRIGEILEEERAALAGEGCPFDPRMEIGIMVEVPGTVRILDRLLRYVDFLSIGTNDLIQYTLAVDRSNQKVSDLYTPFHPAVLSTVQEAVVAGRATGKPVSVCGEAASVPRCAYLFLGMGVDQLSMNPSSIPVVKSMIRVSSLDRAREAVDAVLGLETAEEVLDYLEEVVPV